VDAASPPLAIGRFARAGGFSLGFKQAGWHVIAANDCDTDALHLSLQPRLAAHPDYSGGALSVVLCAVCAANYG
jgi:hypothetical protein